VAESRLSSLIRDTSARAKRQATDNGRHASKMINMETDKIIDDANASLQVSVEKNHSATSPSLSPSSRTREEKGKEKKLPPSYALSRPIRRIVGTCPNSPVSVLTPRDKHVFKSPENSVMELPRIELLSFGIRDNRHTNATELHPASRSAAMRRNRTFGIMIPALIALPFPFCHVFYV